MKKYCKTKNSIFSLLADLRVLSRVLCDLKYIPTIITPSNETPSDQFAGFGKSIMMQGGLPLCLDLVMYFVLQNHGNAKLYNLVSDLSVSPSGFRVAVDF